MYTDSQKKYSKSEKFKKASKKYRESDKGQTIAKKYRESKRGKEIRANINKKWVRSKKGMECRKFYRFSLKIIGIQVYSHGKMCCENCGYGKNIDCLDIDHINNDGAEFRKKNRGISIYAWLQKNNYPKGFQILCKNCNWEKRMENL